ncbi:YxeA family protein [Bacillus cereus]|nr:YxeA family protein [Bacillus cereus]NCA65639.1 DUF1093 domain-containing protein [Bacillus cereus]RKN55064.1 YxeA family protein [Bacillus sp. S66]HDR5352932.1 YxeA family protein [Bacillus thuringiensis]
MTFLKLVDSEKEGKEKELEFFAQKYLREDAFLLVYYSEEKGVKSWEEVKRGTTPSPSS